MSEHIESNSYLSENKSAKKTEENGKSESGNDVEMADVENQKKESEECIVIEDSAEKSLNLTADKSLNLSLNSPLNKSSSSKVDKNLQKAMRIELEKKRLEEKERLEKEKKERARQREEAKKKREEEEAEKKRKQEDLRVKREEEKAKKEAEEAERKRKLEEQKQKQKEERMKRETEEAERKRKFEELRQKQKEERLKKEEEKKKRDEEREKAARDRAEKEKSRLELMNARIEEKKKREQEKLRKEEEERRKVEKIKSSFTSYFIKKENSNSNDKDTYKMHRFMPFEPKPNMKIAPLCRRFDVACMDEEEHDEFIRKLDEELFNQDKDFETYLDNIRKHPENIRTQITRCRRFQEKNDIEIKEIFIDSLISDKTKYKCKYLHFDSKTNKRPPYFGTFRKKSAYVKPRRPLAKDEKQLDYEVDSGDEWEDEPEGESISGSGSNVDEDEEPATMEEEDDDGFFVPHGHLSDDEIDEEERGLDMEAKRAKEAFKRDQWELERKRARKVLVPKCFMKKNFWDGGNSSKVSYSAEELKLLERLQMVPLVTTLPITINENDSQKLPLDESVATSNSKSKASKGEKVGADGSPLTLNSKSKSKEFKQSAMTLAISAASVTPTVPANNTPSIIKFISKMSNKKIKLEQVGGAGSVVSATAVASEAVTSEEKTSSENVKTAEFITETTDSTAAQTTLSKSPCKPKPTDIVPAPSTPLSPKKMSKNLSSTAEKRLCPDENGEGSVKRLKLDTNKSAKNENANAKNEQKKTPAAPLTITALFSKSSACKRSLQLSNGASVVSPSNSVTILLTDDVSSLKMTDSTSVTKTTSGEKLTKTPQKQSVVTSIDKENQDSNSIIMIE